MTKHNLTGCFWVPEVQRNKPTTVFAFHELRVIKDGVDQSIQCSHAVLREMRKHSSLIHI